MLDYLAVPRLSPSESDGKGDKMFTDSTAQGGPEGARCTQCDGVTGRRDRVRRALLHGANVCSFAASAAGAANFTHVAVGFAAGAGMLRIAAGLSSWVYARGGASACNHGNAADSATCQEINP